MEDSLMPIKKKYKKKPYQFIRFLPVLALLLALPITLWAVNNSKEIVNQFAAANEQNIEATKTTYAIPIMVITFLPDDNKDGQIDASVWVPNNPSVVTLRQKIADLNKLGAELMTRATIYKGYKNPTGVPALRLTLSAKHNYEELVTPPLGKTVGNEKQPDYFTILNKYKVCDAVENDGIKEVWMWTPDNDKISVAESNLASKLAGDVSNSPRFQDDLPLCNKSYTVYNYNISKGVENMLHDRGHQMEHLLNEWPKRNDTAADKWKDLLFWGKYVGSEQDHKIYRPGCGWIHIVPNALPEDKRNFWIYQGLGYIYNDVVRDVNWQPNGYIEPRMSDCEDWRPDGKGQKKEISCKVWTSYYYPESVSSCRNPNINPDINTEISYYLWWMQNLPGYGNTLYGTNGEKLRNWWDLMGDIDTVYNSGKFQYLAKTAYDPPPDTTKPSVVIISPSAGKVKGNIDIAGGASDNSGINTIKISIDSIPLKTCTGQSVCTVTSFNTKSLADGSHVIKFEAEDKSPNKNKAEATVTIFVENVTVPSDTKAPDVAIVSPEKDETISGIKNIAAGSSDNVKVASLTLYLDSEVLYKCQNPSLCQYPLDSTKYGSGHEVTNHTISAEAIDSSGNKGIAKVDVKISNIKAPPADTTPPDIAVVSPTNGQVVRDSMDISAGASDSSGLNETNIFLDNQKIYSCTTQNVCQTSYNTKSLGNGGHTVIVESIDKNNNKGSKSVTVVVDNLPPIVAGAPTITITSPTPGSTVSGSSVAITTQASDNGSVSRIRIYIDAVQKKGCTNLKSCSYSLNTTSLINGQHEIKVDAIDNESKVGYKIINVVVKN